MEYNGMELGWHWVWAKLFVENMEKDKTSSTLHYIFILQVSKSIDYCFVYEDIFINSDHAVVCIVAYYQNVDKE